MSAGCCRVSLSGSGQAMLTSRSGSDTEAKRDRFASEMRRTGIKSSATRLLLAVTASALIVLSSGVLATPARSTLAKPAFVKPAFVKPVFVKTAGAKTWNTSDRSSRRYCVRHRHGDFWHSCSDTRHPVFDQSHSHTGRPAYYTPVQRRGSSGFYFGVKSGSMTIDIKQAEAGLPKGIVIGLGRGEYALEIETISTSYSTNSAELMRPLVSSTASTGFDSSYSTTALYGVRRIGDGFYTKMKFGIARNQYVTDGEKQRDSNPSAGIGFGLRFGAILLESEYTYVGSKAKLLSIGASISF